MSVRNSLCYPSDYASVTGRWESPDVIIITYSDIYNLLLEKWQSKIILHIVKHIFLFNVDGISMVYMISK